MGVRLYGGAGNLLTFVSFCDKNTGVPVICGAGYSPENMALNMYFAHSWASSNLSRKPLINWNYWVFKFMPK